MKLGRFLRPEAHRGRWQRRPANRGRRRPSFVLAKKAALTSTCAPHWRKGVAPWEAVAGRTNAAFAGRACTAAPGPNAAFLAVLPPNGFGGTTHLSLDERHTASAKTLPVPCQSLKTH